MNNDMSDLEKYDNNTDNIEFEPLDIKETKEKHNKKKKAKTSRIIINIITALVFIIIILEAGIGIINMQRISNNEEPIWYLSTKTTETELKTVTEYHLGLYKIMKTDTSKETKITLKPFFLKD